MKMPQSRTLNLLHYTGKEVYGEAGQQKRCVISLPCDKQKSRLRGRGNFAG
jgi:hypothetical protein